jgi:hypothetical protein
LLYEIQGPLYYNCDVTADITNVQMEQISEDRVRVTGVKGLPPPPTTKVGITAPAGFQCEWHFFMCGLDIEEKCRITEEQIRHSKFHYSPLGRRPYDIDNYQPWAIT